MTGSVGEEMIHPDPGETAEGDFERTAPVNSKWIWIGFDPAVPLVTEFVEIFRIVAEEPGLGQGHQMLVAVEFPGNFVVADNCEFEEGNFWPGQQRGALAVDAVEMPVNLHAVVEA